MAQATKQHKCERCGQKATIKLTFEELVERTTKREPGDEPGAVYARRDSYRCEDHKKPYSSRCVGRTRIA